MKTKKYKVLRRSDKTLVRIVDDWLDVTHASNWLYKSNIKCDIKLKIRPDTLEDLTALYYTFLKGYSDLEKKYTDCIFDSSSDATFFIIGYL